MNTMIGDALEVLCNVFHAGELCECGAGLNARGGPAADVSVSPALGGVRVGASGEVRCGLEGRGGVSGYEDAMARADRYCGLDSPKTERALRRFARICGRDWRVTRSWFLGWEGWGGGGGMADDVVFVLTTCRWGHGAGSGGCGAG